VCATKLKLHSVGRALVQFQKIPLDYYYYYFLNFFLGGWYFINNFFSYRLGFFFRSIFVTRDAALFVFSFEMFGLGFYEV